MTAGGAGVVHWRESAGSTNDEALALARGGAPDGTAVAARRQTRGRGRLGRTWHGDEPGNVYVSVVHRPTRSPAELSGLTLDVAVAVAGVLALEGVEVALKWPNDLLVGERKLGGILTELHGSPDDDGGVVVIVGVGVNVAARADLPPDVAAIATSVAEVTGRAHDADAIAEAIAGAVARACCEFGVRGVPDRERYLARCASVGRRVRVGGGATGRVTGVDEHGALLVAFDRREGEEAVRAGLVEHLPEEGEPEP